MFSLIETSILLVTFVLLLYKYLIRNSYYFERKNIAHTRPIPGFGNFARVIFKREAGVNFCIRYHEKYKNKKVYGIFDLQGAAIVLRDADLIKRITIKDSDNFVNRRSIMDDRDDPMFGNGIFLMRNEKWKDMRSTLTPAFTGNKMRIMFQLIQECCEEYVKFLKNQLKTVQSNEIEMELKDVFTRFTIDVIATSAFGIKVHSLADRQNQFYTMGMKINVFDFMSIIRFFFISNFKPITRALGMNVFDKKLVGYFKSLVLDSMKYREEHSIYRADMINMLMEARKAADRKRDWTDNEIVAQCFAFFMAGFETTSTAMAFGAYELMANPEVQKRLIAEVDEVNKRLEGKPISYEVLCGMKYLDMVVSETFRKWPGAPFVDRQCNRDYDLEVDDDVTIHLKSGDVCTVNIVGLHYDPDNFPHPHNFDPQRFSEENKENIKPYTYLPFGCGPRSCIGNRFALMEIKAIFYSILSAFSFELSEKATVPIELDRKSFQMAPKGGFWVKLRPRHND